MLTLDETTLFYYNLALTSTSNVNKFLNAIKKWVAGVKPESSVSSKPSSLHSSTLASSGFCSQATHSFAISSTNVDSQAWKTKKAYDGSTNDDMSVRGLSDKDETVGCERDVAIASPFKGKTCIDTSGCIKLLVVTL